ncbi:SNF2 family DNA or RNA helicase [Pseudacidovorax sp. 1753]|uniref:DEAD/DEAH box helicase n=1 Tax=Pseudacidovorax sp. 1753 TaxID=3156419 RepID=UPI0033937115
MRQWKIVGEPFVRSRLKRVFPRMPQRAADSIAISATPENSRELQWFLERYPMTVDRPDVLAKLAQQHIDMEARIGKLIAGHIPPDKIEMAEPPREYQAFVPQFLQQRRGLILADDLGLGKTVSAIACMASPGMLPALVVCPAHLPRQWAKMIHRFMPSLRTHILKKGTVYDMAPKRRRNAQMELVPNSDTPDVIITSYHRLRGWAEELAGKVPLVVYDEGQQLRSPGTLIYEAAQHVAAAATYRLALTATPIYNYGEEFFNVIDVLVPEALGNREEFLREWCTAAPGGKSRLADAKEFGAYLRREGLMLRRTRADVGRELPPLEKIVHEIEADHAQLDALNSDAEALARVVLQHNERFRGEKMQAAGEFDNLMRQATGLAKAPFVAEFVRLLLDSGEPVVLFGWHRAVYDIWVEKLAPFNPVLYTGTESALQKDAAVASFLSGESKVLIMSLRSGAGVDGLQGFCRTVVFGEMDWSPGVHEQCMGRVHRDGAESGCLAYFLLSDAGTDPVMAEVLGVKREQIESVRNPDTALAERIQTGENHLRRLARQFLAKRGLPTIEAEDAAVVPIE